MKLCRLRERGSRELLRAAYARAEEHPRLPGKRVRLCVAIRSALALGSALKNAGPVSARAA